MAITQNKQKYAAVNRHQIFNQHTHNGMPREGTERPNDNHRNKRARDAQIMTFTVCAKIAREYLHIYQGKIDGTVRYVGTLAPCCRPLESFNIY